MLFDIGCNLLEAFDMIYERTGEENPNAIFETRNTNTNEAQPKFSATDISDLFGPATDEGKSNRVKLAKLVYGDGDSFTIQASDAVPWTLVFNKDGDNVVSFDEETKTVTINAKRAAYKKKVADFLAKGLQNKEYTNIDKAHKNTFQDAINQMEGIIKKALKGEDVSISALDKAAQELAEKRKSSRNKNTQTTTNQTAEPIEQQDGNNNAQQDQQVASTNQQQAQPDSNQPKTQNQMYKEFVTKFKDEFTDRIPADCNDPNMNQSDIDDKAAEYFNEIQSPILDNADDNTRNTAYRYVQAAITKHVRSLNGNMPSQNNQNFDRPNNSSDDNFIWGETDDDGDLNNQKPKKTTNDNTNQDTNSDANQEKDTSYGQRIINTADAYKKNFTF